MRSPADDEQVTVHIHGVLVIAHSEKQDAAPTWKKPIGHRPLVRSSTTAKTVPGSRRRPCCVRNADSNTPTDHITAAAILVLAQLPKWLRWRGSGCGSAPAAMAVSTCSSTGCPVQLE